MGLHLDLKADRLGPVAVAAANVVNADKITFSVLERDLKKIPKPLRNHKAIAELYFSLILKKEPRRNQIVTKGCLIDLYSATNPPGDNNDGDKKNEDKTSDD